MALRMKHHLGLATSDLRYEPTALRLRADVDGVTVLDTTDALIVWEPRRIVPVYAVPAEAIAGGIRATDPQPAPPDLGSLPPMLGPTNFDLHTCPGRVVDAGPLKGAGFVPEDPDLGGRVLLDFNAFDGWRAEEDELVGHAHDPFKRIEVWSSGRHIEVSVGGVTLADSRHPRMLLETHLPTRWYLPREDVRMEVLEPSDHQSTCAYKGHASYLSMVGGAEAGKDIGWTYADPLHAAEPVRDLVCFWAERTDVVLDGVPQERPITPWSRPEEQRTADPTRLEFG
jgi:uncharacterized protein (DUF427 family)